MPLVYFIMLVGVLVFVHELGHLVWAKYFGVRVLKVSLGFGPRLAGFRRGETEYVISALPLGGYVRMLGENPWDEVRPKDAERSFANLSLFRRFVIVLAGPFMNLAFPILLYFVVFLGDDQLTPSAIGVVFPDRPADSKLVPGDVVTAIGDEQVSTFYAVNRAVEKHPGQPLRFTILRDGKSVEQTITPVPSQKEGPLDLNEHVGRIGVMTGHPLAIIGVTSPSSPAGAARLRTFDRLVAAAGRPISRYIDIAHVLGNNQGSLVPITYLRRVPVPNALGGLVDLEVYDPRVTTLTPEPGPGSVLARSGIESADLYVSDVTVGSPEHQLGILPGDRILALDGRPVRMFATLLEDVKALRGQKHVLTFRHGEHEQAGPIVFTHKRGVSELGVVIDEYVAGISHWMPTRLDPPIANPEPISYALRESLRATADVVQLTLFSVVRLFQGKLTMKSIGGPLTVLEVTDTAAQQGALDYLTVMAFISINLGLINLLPIPLLDGGHLMFFLFEGVARRPISVRAREYAHLAGLAFLLGIMIIAFKNDLERQWPSIMQLLHR